MSLIFPDGSFTRNFRPADFGGGQMGSPQYQPPQFGMPYQTVSGDPRGGWATAAPQDRPPPFQMGPVQGPWGQSEDPFAARMDFVNQMQQQNMQRQMMFNNGGFSPSQSWGQNPFFGGGYQQPGMAQPIQPPSPGTPYGQPSPWSQYGQQPAQGAQQPPMWRANQNATQTARRPSAPARFDPHAFGTGPGPATNPWRGGQPMKFTPPKRRFQT